MAMSKRLRFEILRRDNHACRYCGASAPDVKLTVDHVVPVALGGKDEPGNLVAACAGCNSGKSSATPDAPIVDDVAADALRWSAAMKKAGAAMLGDLERRKQLHQTFFDHWASWTKTLVSLPANWPTSVDNFVAAGLPMPVLLECVDIAMGKTRIRSDSVFRYMCGIAWSRVTELQEAAKKAVAATLTCNVTQASGETCGRGLVYRVRIVDCPYCPDGCGWHEMCAQCTAGAVKNGLGAPDGSVLAVHDQEAIGTVMR